MDNLVMNQHTTPCIHVARTIPIFINLFTKHFCINMVYCTPKIPNLYLLRCRQYDGGIKLLDHLDTFKNWQIFDEKIVKFYKMPWPLWPMCQTEREIVEISHLAIHKMYTCCIKWGQR